MIEATALTKRYGHVTAVNDVTFTVRPGVVTGFLGRNGAGKSTTMRMVVGLHEPTSGTVSLDGVSYRKLDRPMTRIGVLLDAKAVHPGLSARGYLRGLVDSNGIPASRVGEVLELAGIADVADRRVGGFSLGMGQRLGIAAALLGKPPIIMLDEPLNGLDPDGVLWVRQLMKELAADGCTVFFSSHLMSEMALVADRIIILERGSKLADTTLAQLMDDHAERHVVARVEDDAERHALVTALRQHSRHVDIEQAGTELTIRDADAAAVGRHAAHAGITLSQLTSQSTSLEDVFMAMTAGHTEQQQESNA